MDGWIVTFALMFLMYSLAMKFGWMFFAVMGVIWVLFVAFGIYAITTSPTKSKNSN